MSLIGRVFGALEALQIVVQDALARAQILIALHPAIFLGIFLVLLGLLMAEGPLRNIWSAYNFKSQVGRALEERKATGAPYPGGLLIDVGSQKEPVLVELRVPDGMFDWLIDPNPSGPFTWDLREFFKRVFLFRSIIEDSYIFLPSTWRYWVQRELSRQFEQGQPIDLTKVTQVVYKELHVCYMIVANSVDLNDPAFQAIRKAIERNRMPGRFWRESVMVDMGSHSDVRPFQVLPLSDDDMETFLYGFYWRVPTDLVLRIVSQYFPDPSSRIKHGFHTVMQDEAYKLHQRMRQSLASADGIPPPDFLMLWSHEVYQAIRRTLIVILSEPLQQCPSPVNLHPFRAASVNTTLFDSMA